MQPPKAHFLTFSSKTKIMKITHSGSGIGYQKSKKYIPGSRPETVKAGKAEERLADKSSSPDSGETLYTVSVKCCGRPPLKPG